MSATDVKRRAALGAPNRRRVVAVIGSGTIADPACDEVGRLIATLGFDLLTGGGSGVMAAVSRAFFQTPSRQGVVIGVVPAAVSSLDALEAHEPSDVEYAPPSGYPNDWVEIAIYTHLPATGTEGRHRMSRNHINVLSADAIVALPGQEGTQAEMWLATQYGVPIVAYGDHDAGLEPSIPRARSLEELSSFLRGSIP